MMVILIYNLIGFGLKKEMEQQTTLYMTQAEVEKQLESNTTASRNYRSYRLNSFWV
jgi:hypothetical protein